MNNKRLGFRMFISLLILCILMSTIDLGKVKAAIYSDLPV